MGFFSFSETKVIFETVGIIRLSLGVNPARKWLPSFHINFYFLVQAFNIGFPDDIVINRYGIRCRR